MSEDRVVTVLVSTELLAELGDWSQPVQVKIIETPGVSTGYELIARRPFAYQANIDGTWVNLAPADIRLAFVAEGTA